MPILALVFVLQQPQSAPAKESAQPAKAVSTIRLWETDQEVHKSLGAPTMYFAARAQKFFTPGEHDAAARIYGVLDDVYSRQSDAGEVQIIIGYRLDESESHLHPQLRVAAIDFEFDKRLTLRKGLGAITEAADLCAASCLLTGINRSVNTTVIVEPKNPTPENQVIAQALVSKETGAKYHFKVGITAWFREQGTTFEQLPVEKLRVSLVDPAIEKSIIDSERAQMARSPYMRNSGMQTGSYQELEPWHP
ncbi:MAG TPA: hypothetical protein VF532_25020 [Candidatus Angelobacter sp.]